MTKLCEHCTKPLATNNKSGYCRAHHKLSTHYAAWVESFRASGRKAQSNRKWLSGFTPELVAACLEVQLGHCAICPRRDPDCADHSEATGCKVPRGLLCNWCNLALGFYEKHQRPAGLRIDAYENYLDASPAAVVRSSWLDGAM